MDIIPKLSLLPLLNCSTDLITYPYYSDTESLSKSCESKDAQPQSTVKILKFGTPQTIPIIVLKIDKFDVTLH